ncbi:MAG: cupin domain-containing protein [Pseudomonadota bacterium]
MSDQKMDHIKPWWGVMKPDEGELIWQPEPSRGHVMMKFEPGNMPFDDFSSGIQVLPPGCMVREHGHKHNHELIYVFEGNGVCEIEDETHDVVPGTTILFGRYARHLLENTGDVDMKLFWVFFPPGLETWFRAIGKTGEPAGAMPEEFSRPDNVQEVMEAMRFVPPRPQRNVNKDKT